MYIINKHYYVQDKKKHYLSYVTKDVKEAS